MTRIFRILAFFLFISCQLAFLTAILFEKLHHSWIMAGIGMCAALITYAYYHKSVQEEAHFIHDLQDILYVSAGSLFTYIISTDLDLGPVIAAGLTGTLASYLPDIFKKHSWMRRIPVPAYCGAFVGMTAPTVSSGHQFIIFSGFLTGVLFITAKNIFNGVGGKLGTIAFGGVALSSLMVYLLF